jgi:hypothetical protein
VHTDAELAQLFSHQIAHTLLEHARERHSLGEIMWPICVFGWITMNLPLSPLWGIFAEEVEADKLGMLLAAKASFESAAAVELWTRIDVMKSA